MKYPGFQIAYLVWGKHVSVWDTLSDVVSCAAWLLYVLVVWTVVLLIAILIIVIALSTNFIVSLIPISM